MSGKGKTIKMYDSPGKAIRTRARNLPFGKCYVNSDWKTGHLANVIVTRLHVNGNVTAGMYLVDLLCLGVKESWYLFNESKHRVLEFLNKDDGHTFIEIDYK